LLNLNNNYTIEAGFSRKKSLMLETCFVLSVVRLDAAFLPSVRTGFNHSATSCLRECSMLMLAYGRNAI